MTAPDALKVQMDFGGLLLDTAGNSLLDTAGRTLLDTGWADVIEDVLTTSPIVVFQGQRDSGPADRVADSGSIKFTLRNDTQNSAGLVGYYSPNHANLREGFALGAKVRVGLEKDGLTEWFLGRIVTIEPVAGNLNAKTVDVVAADWMEIASRTPMPRIPVMESVTDDQVIQAIVDAMDDPPSETDLAVGAYTYPYALTDVEDQETVIMTVLQRLAQSGLGRVFVVGGTSGESLKYVDLFALLTTGTPVATFDNDFISMGAKLEAYKRVKRVVTTVYPFNEDASAVVLYTLTDEISIAPGETLEFVGYYRDPNANSSQSIPAVDVVTPVVNTDFKFSSVSGSGTDLNASLAVTTFEAGSKAFYVKFTNNAVVTGYLWFMQVRGKGLYAFDTISYTALDTTVREGQGTTLNHDMPYQSTYAKAKEIGDAFLTWYGQDVTEVPSLEFLPTLSDTDYAKMVACQPGELISVSDDVTGISYTMVAIGREIQIWNGGNYITERLFVSPAQEASALYFTLDTLGQDDLDNPDVVLAFG